MAESNTLFVTDENGNELEMEILFTFEDDKKKRNYVVFNDPKDEEGEVFASAYDDEGNLLPIETEEEWAMVEEVIGAFGEDGTVEEA
ncbi:MAG: DUF1292 domain-containing protein [Erysipelotrichaceae bacterium]